MEEKNSTVGSHHQSPVNAKDEPPGPRSHQVVQQEATGGTMETKLGGVVAGGSGSVMSSVVETTFKRKRGRPRKYGDAVANTIPLALLPPGFLPSPPVSCEKRGRGRPRGSGKLQLLASIGGFAAETAGGSFTPHVLTVHTGEDIVSTILSFSQRSTRAVCILSATGVVSSVVIRQPGSSGGILRYEGRFEILSLCGSFTFGEMSGSHRKNGTLSVSLAKPDGRVFGGGVAGSLFAAGPIQLILASFKQDIRKELKMRQPAESSTAASVLGNQARVPMPVVGITNCEENCTTPTSALLEPTNGEAGNTVTVNHKVNPESQDGGGPNVLQSSQPISDQRISPALSVGVPQN